MKPIRNKHGDVLARVSWQDFEHLLADHYRGLGYRVEHCGTAGSGTKFDGGIDLKLRKDGQYILVQCKHWNAMQVPHNDVHQLMGIMDNEDATGAILITSGEFTAAAKKAGGKKGRVDLIDGIVLREMLGSRLELLAAKEGNSPQTAEPRAGGFFGDPVERTGTKSLKEKAPITGHQILVGFCFALVIVSAAYFFLSSAIAQLGKGLVQPSTQQTILESAPASTPLPRSDNYSSSDQSKLQPPEAARVPSQIPVPQTEAEFREWKRKNDESMKILEATTPELKR